MDEHQGDVEVIQNDQESTLAASSNEYEARMLEAFVGKPERPDKGLWYANAFAKFEVDGVEKIAWKWSWWAFFGGIWFLFYRKAYTAAGGLFLVSIISQFFIPFSGILIPIFMGGFGTYFVYKVYKAKKLEIEAASTDREERIAIMAEVGGYNQWAIWIGVALNALFVIAVFAGMLAPELANVQ